MNRKATALRILQGNPSKRPLSKAEPQPLPASTYCPRWLPEAAKWYWRRLAPMLSRLGLLTETDVYALSELSVCLARAQEAENLLTEHGLLVEGSRGNLVKNPVAALAKEYRLTALRLFSKFGMTPSDRAGISVDVPAEESEFERFMRNKER